MTDQPSDKDLLPALLGQNPSPVEGTNQDRTDKVQEQVDRILGVFKQLLGSNYVSDVPGPHYMLRFQTAAEIIADFQITAQEAFADGFWEYTRPEFLFQIMGLMVFPDARADGIPSLDGDITYRDFLRKMVELLLAGATKDTVQQGLELLSDAVFEIIERGVEARKMGDLSGWGPQDKFTFEINASNLVQSVPAADVGITEPDPVDLYGFPNDPFVLQENVRLVLKALKPAHTLYDYRHLFRDAFGSLFTDTPSWDLRTYYYDDFRKNCLGAKQITGTAGVTWADTSLFSDVSRDFSSLSPGTTLVVTSGTNSANASAFDEGYKGHYRVESILVFPVGTDTTARSYTTSPTGLSGFATVDGEDIEDSSQDWASAVEGEVLTFLEGPNAGAYRLKTLLGNDGGPVGYAPGPATRVRAAPSLLRIRGWMPVAATGQSYYVGVDRLGAQEPRIVQGEDVTAQFTSLAPGTKDLLLTQRGPLVKGWGDATPATVQDVTVYVDGTPVDVLVVNPYIGSIQLTAALPLMDPAAPAHTVTVDYKWMATPIMALAGLNTLGLVLNKWDLSGRMPRTPRFPMGVVLGPNVTRRAPPIIGHRYLGYEQAYSSLLNSPTTLLLNQDPRRVSVPAFERMPEPVAVAYEGVQVPTASETRVWALKGTDGGGVNIGGLLAGTYTVTDSRGFPYDPEEESATVYYRGVDLSFPSAVNIVGRFFGIGGNTPSGLNPLNKASVALDGVFTGIAFGVHNNKRLYMVGALVVNGVEHVGLLLDAQKPHLEASWKIGPVATLSVQDPTTAVVPTADIPTSLQEGGRFQVLEGTQAGVYTVDTIIRQTDGTTTLTVSPAFPANQNLWGNRDVEAVFEVLWSAGPSTYRLTADPEAGVAQVSLSGTTVGTVASISSAPTLPQPANTSLLLSPNAFGQVFWGSLSRKATNSSTWSFYRYSVTPDETTVRDHRITVESLMGVAPEDDTDPWHTTQSFGFRRLWVDPFGGGGITSERVILKSTSAHPDLDFTFGYGRYEPFLTPKATLDLRSWFLVDSGCVPGDASIVINDSEREVRLGTLTYWEDAGQDPYRQMVLQPQASYSGLMNPTDMGWGVESATGIGSSERQGRVNTISVSGYQTTAGSLFYRNTDIGSLVNGVPWAPTGSFIAEARFAVQDYTADGSDFVGMVFSFGHLSQVGMGLVAGATPKVRILDPTTGLPVIEHNFDWTDGEVHTYRFVVDGPGSVLLPFIDGDSFPSTPLAAFPPGTGPSVAFGAVLYDPVQELTVDWYSTSWVCGPPAGALRTLGVYRGGDKSDIDNWELPRTDSTTEPNSSRIGPVIKEMDWTSALNVRILRDPTWGVTVYRPDIPLPPYYTPDDITGTVPGGGFITDTTEPSAGWINVEYRNLPQATDTFGSVKFGALEKGSVTQQQWSYLNYRLFKHPTEDYRAPQHMVLNRFNIINSGERTKDVTPEQVVVQTVNSTELTLLPTHLYADQVFKVIDGTEIYSPDQFLFEAKSQHLTLLPKEGGTPREFSGDPVTVVFSPGRTVTNTYLCSQPVLDSVTLLNEGTPPVPKSQSTFYERHVVYGPDILTDPPVDDRLLADDALNPPNVLGDDYRVHVFREGDDPATALADSLYENMEFCEVSSEGQTGVLSTICEGTLGQGASGWDPDVGDPIYSPTGTGPQYPGAGWSGNLFESGGYVGEPFGPFVLSIGTYQETGFTPQASLGGLLGQGFVWGGGGVEGIRWSPGASPMPVWQPVLVGGSDSSVVITMQDTGTGATTVWEFVE